MSTGVQMQQQRVPIGTFTGTDGRTINVQITQEWWRPIDQIVKAINAFVPFGGVLPVANGGTGTATPGLIAGPNVAITGVWPNQTISSTGGGGISALTGDVTASGVGSVAATLASVATAGSYTSANITIDAKGRVLSASNGSSGSSRYIRGAGWSGAGSALSFPANDVAITCQATGTIQSVTVLGIGGNGSCVVDVWKSTYAAALPTVANSIVAAAFPTIAGAAKSQDSTLTGWTTAVTAGDVLVFHLVSVSVFTALQIILEIA